MSHFALLGRIIGLALLSKVPLPGAFFADAFLKAVFGYDLILKDLESTDPDLHKQRIVYLADSVYRDQGLTLEDLGLVFADESNDEAYTGRSSVELKQGGDIIEVHPPAMTRKANPQCVQVTEENKAEYLQLFVKHRLLESIRPQVEAVRRGITVVVDEDLMKSIRTHLRVSELKLLMCGTPEIDVDDWETSTTYSGGYTTSSNIVQWFWAIVREMDRPRRSQLLQFCTGSPRVPATGFSNLMGYSGALNRFCIQKLDGNPTKLPTAATCFNTLKLPEYSSQALLESKLILAIYEASGFDEGAVAV